MPIPRRRFVLALGTVSTSPVVFAQGPAPLSAPRIVPVAPDQAAEPVLQFFTPTQFATLRHAASLLQPAYSNLPGAVEAAAPEFLDFLLAVSPAPRQALYRGGLDHLTSQAKLLFKKDFAALTAPEADQILKPLIVPWTFDPPADLHERFLTDLRADLRTATTNSAPYAAAAATTSRRGRGRTGAGLYWLPIDPTRR